MKPTFQTIIESGKGNCLAACIASILEVSIDEIPDLKCGVITLARHWQGDKVAYHRWLTAKRFQPKESEN